MAEEETQAQKIDRALGAVWPEDPDIYDVKCTKRSTGEEVVMSIQQHMKGVTLSLPTGTTAVTDSRELAGF